MDNNFYNLAAKRRSIYNLGSKEVLPQDDVIALVEKMVKEAPTAFNSQSGRVVVLFGKDNQKLWNMLSEALIKIVPAEAFVKTEQKINSFAKGSGTILYFIDDEATKSLQDKFPLYKDNFPIWGEQSSGMLQYMVWTALAEQNIGASLQHYNPLIDAEIHKEWNLPQSWRLRAQMPFGSIEAPADEKSYLPIEQRMKVFK